MYKKNLSDMDIAYKINSSCNRAKFHFLGTWRRGDITMFCHVDSLRRLTSKLNFNSKIDNEINLLRPQCVYVYTLYIVNGWIKEPCFC